MFKESYEATGTFIELDILDSHHGLCNHVKFKKKSKGVVEPSQGGISARL